MSKKEIKKITGELAERKDLLHFMLSISMALDMTDDTAKKLSTLMSVYTMGYLNGMGFDEDELVGMMQEDERKEMN